MTAVRVTHPPSGPRVYLGGHVRLHHGMTGSVLAAAGVALHQPALVAVGLLLMAHDAKDFPWTADR